jgi:hypothetical protein
MSVEDGDTTTPADDSGMTIVLTGEAIAIGQDTLTSVDATSSLAEHENLTKATGVVTAISIADASGGEIEFAIAFTDVDFSGVDKIHIKTSTINGEQDGVSYEISVLTFTAMDHDHKVGETTVKYKDKSPEVDHQGHDYIDFTIDLDGNVAIATFDARVSAENSLVIVDAAVLADEDDLSVSAVMITAAVG